jgi:hypothetical protein
MKAIECMCSVPEISSICQVLRREEEETGERRKGERRERRGYSNK